MKYRIREVFDGILSTFIPEKEDRVKHSGWSIIDYSGYKTKKGAEIRIEKHRQAMIIQAKSYTKIHEVK